MNYKLMHDSTWINIFNGTLCIWSSVSIYSVVQLRYQKAALFLWSNQTFVHVIFFFQWEKDYQPQIYVCFCPAQLQLDRSVAHALSQFSWGVKKIKAGLPSRKQLYYFEYVCETDVGCVVVCFFKHCRYDCLKSCETSLRVLEKHIHFRQVLAGVDTRCVSDHMDLYPTPNMFQCTRVSR